MTNSPRLVELGCPRCGETSLSSAGEIAHRLAANGMLRRESDPEWEVMVELLKSLASSLTCSDCAHQGLVVREADEFDDEAWGMGRRCEMCGQPIPPERLEIFPDSRTCAICKNRDEQGMISEDIEFCPKCGGVMELKPSRGVGITRYTYRCTECGG